MTSEAHLWDALRPLLHGLDPVRIENLVTLGVPDVNYTRGWIELKYVKAWPVREDTPLRVPHFTPQQRGWLRRRRLAGGRAFVLIAVGEEWILFDGWVAAEYLGKTTKKELEKHWLRRWPSTPTAEDIQKWI